MVQFYLGEVLYNRGLNDAALVALQRAVQLNPDNASAHYLMAFVLGDMGRHQEARTASKRAIELNPPLARAQANLSLERIKSNERKSQPYLVREALEMEVVEGRELAHFNLGLAFRQKGYYVEALREYRLALERGEDRRLVLQAMAEVHLLRRDFGPALELYETLVLEVPDSPKLWNERGVVLHQAGRVDEALASYRRAAEIDAKYALAWNNLGVALAHQGGTEDAVEAFRTALHLQSTFAAARLNLALLLFHIRRLQLALEAYRQVLADEPKNASAWNGVGLVLVELKRFADARNAFARAVEADPRHAGAHYNLSFTLSNLGDFDGALRATKRALELDPYYVAQKFALTIDLQYEEATIGVVPQISADVTAESLGSEFTFDQRLLDNIFQELAPPEPARDEPDARRPARPGARLREQGAVRSGGGGGDARRAARRRRDRGHDADRRSVRQARPARRSAGALPRGPRARPRADRGAARGDQGAARAGTDRARPRDRPRSCSLLAPGRRRAADRRGPGARRRGRRRGRAHRAAGRAESRAGARRPAQAPGRRAAQGRRPRRRARRLPGGAGARPGVRRGLGRARAAARAARGMGRGAARLRARPGRAARPTTRPRWRSPTCSAGWAGCARRSRGSPTCWSRIPTTSRP